MKINPDRTVQLEKGEYIPFNCPRCKWSIPYDEKLIMVRCTHCRYFAPVKEFSHPFISYPPVDK